MLHQGRFAAPTVCLPLETPQSHKMQLQQCVIVPVPDKSMHVFSRMQQQATAASTTDFTHHGHTIFFFFNFRQVMQHQSCFGTLFIFHLFLIFHVWCDNLACVTFTVQHVILSWPLTVAAETIDTCVYRWHGGPCEQFSDEIGQYATHRTHLLS